MEQKMKEQARQYFLERFIPTHRRNIKKLKDIKEFDVNPFLRSYISRFFSTQYSKESVAKALIYPRALGTSMNTTFGNFLKGFCCSLLSENVKNRTPKESI